MSAPVMAGDSATARRYSSLVIFTRVEALIRQHARGPCEISRDAFRVLSRLDVPLILVSESPAEDIRQLQGELELRAPFISDRGAALHVPADYFREVDLPPASEETWEVFRFDPPDQSAAIRLLAALFNGERDVLTIGLGCDDCDFSLLAAVDVPIVVRDDGRDQRALLREVPGAYLTNASGTAGWSEVLLAAPSH